MELCVDQRSPVSETGDSGPVPGERTRGHWVAS